MEHLVWCPIHDRSLTMCSSSFGGGCYDWSIPKCYTRNHDSYFKRHLFSNAYLADQLRELTFHGSITSHNTLQTTFAEFQKVRRPRAESFLQSTNLLVRLESLDDPFLEYLFVACFQQAPRGSFIVSSFRNMYTRSIIKYLPTPSKCGVLPFEDEIQICPRTRSL